MKSMKILDFGSNGLVGSSLKRHLNNNKKYELFFFQQEKILIFSHLKRQIIEFKILDQI